MTTTPNPDYSGHYVSPEAQARITAEFQADVLVATRALVEAVRGRRAGGPVTALQLVRTANLTDHGLVVAAVGALTHTIERLCAKADELDVDEYLSDWLADADRRERDALADLATARDAEGGDGA